MANGGRRKPARTSVGRGAGKGPGGIVRVLLSLAVAVATTYGWYAMREDAPAVESASPSASTPASPSPPASSSTPPSPTTSASSGASSSASPAPSVTAHAYTDYPGTVTSVADGDTVRFRSGGRELRIRIDSIDAPEQDGGAKRPGQPYARQSQNHLQTWVQGRSLTARCFETDQYNRSVCDLLDSQGESAARAQVRAGYAWAYTAAQGRYLRDKSLVTLQEQARAAGRGLWQNRQVIAPWVWRYDCWRENKCVR